jgi:signal transduction histidine kinase
LTRERTGGLTAARCWLLPGVIILSADWCGSAHRRSWRSVGVLLRISMWSGHGTHSGDVGGVILENDAAGGRAGYRCCVIADRPAQGASAPVRRWSIAADAESPWLAIVVLTAAAGAVVLTSVTRPLGIHQNGQQMLIPLLLCVPVVVLRRWPLPVLGAVTVAAGLVTARGVALLPFGVMLGLALYYSALRLPRPRSIVLALAVAGLLGVAVVYSAFSIESAQVTADVVDNFVPLAGGWFIADGVAARRRYQAGLAVQAERERAAEAREERVRIAREMHDIVAHTLAVMTVQAGVGRRLAGKRPEEAISALESIETIGRTAQDELSIVLGLLRDGESGTAPLAPLPRLIDIKDLVDTVRASGTPVELHTEGADRVFSASLELSIYRVMQEALTNVVKHAPGARAVAELSVTADKVRLDVRDDGGRGRGEAAQGELGTGHGIAGMRERVGAFGGWLIAERAADGGFWVIAEIPIEGAAS